MLVVQQQQQQQLNLNGEYSPYEAYDYAQDQMAQPQETDTSQRSGLELGETSGVSQQQRQSMSLGPRRQKASPETKAKR